MFLFCNFRDLIKKLLVQDRTKRLGNMKVNIETFEEYRQLSDQARLRYSGGSMGNGDAFPTMQPIYNRIAETAPSLYFKTSKSLGVKWSFLPGVSPPADAWGLNVVL